MAEVEEEKKRKREQEEAPEVEEEKKRKRWRSLRCVSQQEGRFSEAQKAKSKEGKGDGKGEHEGECERTVDPQYHSLVKSIHGIPTENVHPFCEIHGIMSLWVDSRDGRRSWRCVSQAQKAKGKEGKGDGKGEHKGDGKGKDKDKGKTKDKGKGWQDIFEQSSRIWRASMPHRNP